jgi:hypothetical protein
MLCGWDLQIWNFTTEYVNWNYEAADADAETYNSVKGAFCPARLRLTDHACYVATANIIDVM